MESYIIMKLPDGYNFKQIKNQLLYQYFDGTNIKTISKWKVGFNCNIEYLCRVYNVIGLETDESKLIDYVDGLAYKDSKIYGE